MKKKNTSGAQKDHAPNIEGSPPKNQLDVSHFFLLTPRQTERGWIHPSSPPGLCIHLLFPPHPWGGTWPRIFTLLTMGIRPAWHLIQKNSLKNRLKDGAGTAAWSEVETQKNTHPEPHIIFWCWGVSYLNHLANAWVTERTNTGFLKKLALSAQKTRVWTH